MQTYKYSAMATDGTKINGIVEAVDEYTAVDQIKKSCPIVLSVKEVEVKDGFLQKEIGSKFDAKNVSIMCSQFAIMLHAGIDIATCMTMIASQTKDKKLKRMLELSSKDVLSGHSIAKSFEKNCKGIPITFIETVRAGEMSGNLEESFRTLEDYYDRSYKVKEKIRLAMMYPIFVLIIAIIVLNIVMTVVIPKLAQIFDNLHGELPGITVALINFSKFWAANWAYIAIAILALFIGLKIYHHSENGKLHWAKVKIKIWVFGQINLAAGCSDFCSTMSSLLTAGLPLTEALDVTAKVLDNYWLATETRKIREKVEVGYKLGDALLESEVFPNTLSEMIGIGENSGNLAEILMTTSDYYSNEANYKINKAINRLEPTMLIILVVFTAFIVFAIYFPVFTMYDLM